MTKIKNKIDNTPLLSIVGIVAIVVMVTLLTTWAGMKTALAMEPYVKGYDVVSYETYIVCQGDTLYEIAEEHLDNFPETSKENRLKCYVMCIAQYNGIYESSSELRWGETIKLPIVTGSKTANLKSVG